MVILLAKLKVDVHLLLDLRPPRVRLLKRLVDHCRLKDVQLDFALVLLSRNKTA